MIKASADTNWLPLFEALASEVRLNIIRLLAEQPMNNKDLASHLKLSGAIVSMHVRKLQETGIVRSEMIRLDGGTHKMNTLAVEAIEILFPFIKNAPRLFHEISIPIGHYNDFEIAPTCGLATTSKLIGQFDDPRFFLDPERVNAGILWFGKGYVEFKLPNYLLSSQKIEEIEISLELGSEAPGVNRNWPSDISFILNGTELGYWTSPGDSGEGRGTYTPAWWRDDVNQYGFLKQIQINANGTYLDGQKMSDIGLPELAIERNQWTLRLEVKEDAAHVGGLTLYGAGFGNYNQDIVFRTYYKGSAGG
ncbi:ArsR/SmtB family transcription factor [Paenibacillus wynnii]|uniref:ArsR/SmtB family transcription factor n=1 Tax=Paenibacillus wynnii TaxID=268407 RepID=UPI0027950086|nr:ArsR family transcriptional regulator [Paenibacillus wynnii]MDQ0192773.1 putative transcriptional regulator [Paenibacillus wynnii]